MAHILIIDDVEGVRRAVDTALRQAGHSVTVANDGVEGLEKLTQDHFDLVIVDILMPRLDGTDVIYQLADQPDHPPIMAISGGGAGISAHEALRAARFKADAFLVKPFEKNTFLALVDKLIGSAA